MKLTLTNILQALPDLENDELCELAMSVTVLRGKRQKDERAAQSEAGHKHAHKCDGR